MDGLAVGKLVRFPVPQSPLRVFVSLPACCGGVFTWSCEQCSLLLLLRRRQALSMTILARTSSHKRANHSSANSLLFPSPVTLPHVPSVGSADPCGMATTTIVQKADSPTLKRAFAHDLEPNTYTPSNKCVRTLHHDSNRPYHSPDPSYWPTKPGNRSPRSGQRPTNSRRPSMVQTSSRTSALPMPSFMSVFGEEVSNTGIKGLSDRSGTSANGNTIGRPASSGNIPNGSNTSNSHFSAFHVHRDSTSTLASESSDSSPTTTISTMDSSSVTDPSPGPSPESPIAKTTPSSFVPDFRSRRADNGSSENSPNTFFELQRPTTPAKKARNLKNLGINTSSSLGNLRSNLTGSLPALAVKEKNPSAPTSPSFIKPPTPPKRRPSNLSLTIQTPGAENQPIRLIIPSAPVVSRPGLRHFQSSPSLPLCSPSVIPNGGMKLPLLRPIKTNPHGFAEVPNELEEEDQEPNFDIPQSREEKPAAYPHGPICIYESGVYLYFEPTAEQAATFDVIMNVASEVKNPFLNPISDSQKDIDARRVDGPPAENVDFATLPERTKTASFDTQASSPTTPKATPVLETIQPGEHVVNGTSLKRPEYIHMLWEHNTDIVPDLYKLVKTMDERVQQGKRVLVHCQCGVSRSASLIVAYGIYKNPGISVQEAYDAVKKRSKWIGPNMNLIMQLQEFRNGLLRANETRTHNQGFGFPRRSAGLPTGVSNGTNRHSPFDKDVASISRTPRTAPLPPDTDMNMQRASTGNMFAISPGPLSAPSGAFFSPGCRRSWAPSQTNFDLSPKSSPAQSATPYVDPKGQVVPVLSINHNDSSSTQLESGQSKAHDEPEQPADSRPLSVPNFSRQLPIRAHDNVEYAEPAISESLLTIPTQATDFGLLRSPAVSSFNIPPRVSTEPTHSSELFSPIATEFNLRPWPESDDATSWSSSTSNDHDMQQPPMSPRSTEFHVNGLNQGEIDGSYTLVSPGAASTDLDPLPVSQQSTGCTDPSSEDFEILSPTVTEFPKDPFARTNGGLEIEITSPRATEFHMTPLKPRVADSDPYGLTSPTRNEFAINLTPQRNGETDFRRPSFQAILPPSHLAQPEAVNGFASLDGTAQRGPTVSALLPISVNEAPKSQNASLRMDSLSTTLETVATASVEPCTPQLSHFESSPPRLPETPEQTFLSTPSRQNVIRTRFSSPNMREQRRLHKLQTEMEALLPHRSPRLPQAVDDLDALMSPRAEEFTRNPFHFEPRSPVDDPSPASSNETIRDGQNHGDWQDTHQGTPQKVAEDPRSPVQAGSSPIVRSIWDVL